MLRRRDLSVTSGVSVPHAVSVTRHPQKHATVLDGIRVRYIDVGAHTDSAEPPLLLRVRPVRQELARAEDEPDLAAVPTARHANVLVGKLAAVDVPPDWDAGGRARHRRRVGPAAAAGGGVLARGRPASGQRGAFVRGVEELVEAALVVRVADDERLRP